MNDVHTVYKHTPVFAKQVMPLWLVKKTGQNKHLHFTLFANTYVYMGFYTLSFFIQLNATLTVQSDKVVTMVTYTPYL